MKLLLLYLDIPTAFTVLRAVLGINHPPSHWSTANMHKPLMFHSPIYAIAHHTVKLRKPQCIKTWEGESRIPLAKPERFLGNCFQHTFSISSAFLSGVFISISGDEALLWQCREKTNLQAVLSLKFQQNAPSLMDLHKMNPILTWADNIYIQSHPIRLFTALCNLLIPFARIAPAWNNAKQPLQTAKSSINQTPIEATIESGWLICMRLNIRIHHRLAQYTRDAK